MEKQESWNDQVGLFLNGKLRGKALKHFRAQLQKDKELQEEVAFQQALQNAVTSSQNDQWRSAIKKEVITQWPQSQLEDLNSKKGSLRFLRTRAMAIAASLVLLFGLAWGYAQMNFKNQTLASAHIKLLSPASNTKGENRPELSLFEKVDQAYQAQDYAKAEELLMKIPSGDDFLKAQFHLANLYMHMDSPEKAISKLQSIIKTKDIRFVEEAEWLLALAHLQKNQEDLAIDLLTKIARDANHGRANKAQALLDKLHSSWRRLLF